MFQALDAFAIRFAARFAHQSPLFDHLYVGVLGRPSYKIAPLVVCIWALWLSKKDRLNARRAAIKAGAAGALALLVGRIIQNFHSERVRPLHANNPDYIAPYGVNPGVLKEWSSFPSDHAALSFAISAGVMSFSRPMGIFCVLWSLFVVCMPRVYSGYHYATDILAGMVLGVATYFSMLCLRPVFDKVLVFAERLEDRYTPAFYGLAFFASLQIVTMFDDIRIPINQLAAALK